MSRATMERDRGLPRDGRETRWAVGAAIASVVGARLAVTAPVWAWSFGGIVSGAVAAVTFMPLGTAAGLVALKGVMPRSAFLLVIAIVLGLVAMSRGAWRDLPRVPAVAFALLLLIALPTVMVTQAPWENIQFFYMPKTDWEFFPITSYEVLAALSLVSIGALSLLVANGVRTADHFETFMGAVCLGAAYPIAIGIKDRITGNLAYHDGTPSIAANMGHPNAMAIFLLAAVPIVAGYAAYTQREKTRWAVGLLALLGLGCLVLTFTRSAWMALVVGIVVVGILAGRVRYILAIAGIALTLGFLTGSGQEVVKRLAETKITTKVTGASGDSWQWRLETWTGMLEARPPKLLSGFGFGSYSRRTVEVFGGGSEINVNIASNWRKGFGAHNDYLSMLEQNGVPGLALWTTFMFSIAVMAGKLWRRRRNPVALGVVASSVGLIVMSISDNVQGADFSWSLVAAALTACLVLERRTADSRSSAPS